MTDSSEYIKISYLESLYSQKNLLLSEMELLTSTKHLLEYKNLRKRENNLKISLKTRMKECLSLIKDLESSTPKVKLYPEQQSSSESLNNTNQTATEIESNTLDLELQRIKNKLSALQAR